MIKYRQLEALHAVIQTGSITEASHRLCISQPGTSNLIANLEHAMKLTLFERIKGRLHPTPEALRLAGEVEGLIEGFDKLCRRATALRDTEIGHLDIASMPALSLDLLPDVLDQFLTKRPGVEVNLMTRSSTRVQELVADHQAEIGIAEGPLEHPNLVGTMYRVPCYMVLPDDHPLATRDVLTPADLDGTPMIPLDTNHMTYHRQRQAFAEDNRLWRASCITQHFYVALALVRKGRGIALIDPFTLEAQNTEGLSIKTFHPTISLDIAVIHADNRSNSIAFQHFKEQLTSQLEEAITSFPGKYGG